MVHLIMRASFAAMKRVLITGGSKGLGLALCKQFLEAGYEVSTFSRSTPAAVEALKAQYAPHFRHVILDLARLENLESLDDFMETDIFIANAGMGLEGLLTLTSEEAIRRCIEINLTSTILLTRQVLKGMLIRGHGCLVFVSSIAARTGLKGLSIYSATKGGLVSFSRSIAREYGSRGIRSNCILPGFLESDMTAEMDVNQRAGVARRTTLGRLGMPNDVTGCVEFLVSDPSRYITGQEFVVDGGFTV